MAQEYKAFALGHGLTALVCKDMRTEKAGSPAKLHMNGSAISNSTTVTVQQASTYDEGGYAPPESVMVSGNAVVLLRDALIEQFPIARDLNPLGLLKVVPGMVISLVIRLDDKFNKDFVVAVAKDLEGAGFRTEFQTLPDPDASDKTVKINVRYDMEGT